MAQGGPTNEMKCSEVRELLSDLLDIQRGENPSPDVSPLGRPETRSAVEKHVDDCLDCSEALHELEELGAAFSDFNISEKPTQDFADFGSVVRERMGQKGPRILPEERRDASPFGRQSWWTMLISSVAAVVVVGVLVHSLWNSPNRPTTTSPEIADVSPNSERPLETARSESEDNATSPTLKMVDTKDTEPGRLPRRMNPIPAQPPALKMPFHTPFSLAMRRPRGPVQSVRVDPAKGGMVPYLRQFDRELHDFGSLSLGETPQPEMGNKTLLGLYVALQAPRNISKDSPEGLRVSRVAPGSPAAIAGLRPGDYITGMELPDGRPLETFKTSTSAETLIFLRWINGLGKGKAIVIEYQRPESSQWLLKSGIATLGEWKLE